MMGQRVRLATKLAGSFALMVLIAGILGGVGWWSFTEITTKVNASTAATQCIEALEAARAHERDFKVKGFTKDAASGKSSDELWREAQADLEQKLARLADTRGFSAADQERSRGAVTGGAEYAQAFATLAASRKARDEGFAGWADIGWKLTEKVGAARGQTIDPARAAARGAADLAAVQRWDDIALGLDQGVIQNFLLMRLLGAFLGAMQTDEIWEKYQAQYTKTKDALTTWTTLVAGETDLEAAARQLGEYMDQHKACGQKFYDAIVAARQADTALAAAAAVVTSDCRELANTQAAGMRAAVARGRNLMVGFAAGGLLAGILLGTVLTRSITRPINRIVAALSDGARQVNDAAQQVAGASQQLASGASEQAASIEETSSALEQMAAMTRTNAENARKASELSEQARTAAQSGDQVMARLNTSMAGINEASAQISKIIKVIEEIAFQTNLLALNAAVEAARAGEHGKGFAVVAEEVRNLAQRAAQAARETTALIESSVGRAKEGAAVATEVTSALTGIVGDVAKVSELIEGIARASAEQAQGVDQVNLAVNQMDKVTQQTAASAEESASAAEQLSAQAVSVDAVVSELASLVRGGAERADVVSAAPEHPAKNRLAPPTRHSDETSTHPPLPTAQEAGPPGDF